MVEPDAIPLLLSSVLGSVGAVSLVPVEPEPGLEAGVPEEPSIVSTVPLDPSPVCAVVVSCPQANSAAREPRASRRMAAALARTGGRLQPA